MSVIHASCYDAVCEQCCGRHAIHMVAISSVAFSMRHATNCCIPHRVLAHCITHRKRCVLLVVYRRAVRVTRRMAISLCDIPSVIAVRYRSIILFPRHWTCSEIPRRDAASPITCRGRIVGHIVWRAWFALCYSPYSIPHVRLSQAWFQSNGLQSMSLMMGKIQCQLHDPRQGAASAINTPPWQAVAVDTIRNAKRCVARCGTR